MSAKTWHSAQPRDQAQSGDLNIIHTSCSQAHHNSVLNDRKTEAVLDMRHQCI